MRTSSTTKGLKYSKFCLIFGYPYIENLQNLLTGELKISVFWWTFIAKKVPPPHLFHTPEYATILKSTMNTFNQETKVANVHRMNVKIVSVLITVEQQRIGIHTLHEHWPSVRTATPLSLCVHEVRVRHVGCHVCVTPSVVINIAVCVAINLTIHFTAVKYLTAPKHTSDINRKWLKSHFLWDM